MVFDTIAISELQKSPARAFKSTRGVKWVLQNNKKAGALITPYVLELLEKYGFFDLIEDALWAEDKELEKREIELQTMVKDGRTHELLSVDDL